ncbi:unnamed protein product [Echinostoma caproni]|uniref:E3 ubiquitin-protein ligase n=1 Tax=Echinostoma caproni TaxID=27848 RepID=A0A183B385_9TREM|nr:unnamed protein product [Echinostoma caproni]
MAIGRKRLDKMLDEEDLGMGTMVNGLQESGIEHVSIDWFIRDNRGSSSALLSINAAGDGSASWLEGGKPLFTVQLDSLSSIYTNAPVLARFFRACSELAGRVLHLPTPGSTAGGLKTKTNRVTFRDDPIEGQCPASERPRPSVPAGSTFSDCGRHLCSAVKGLWVIDLSALIHFLPPLFNQFMELIIISATASHRWSLTASAHDATVENALAPKWMDFGRSADTTNSPNEILRTTIGTMAVLISELNAACPVTRATSSSYYFDSRDLCVGKMQSDLPRHELIRNYVKFAFDSDTLTARCATLHANQDATKAHSTARQTVIFPIPLHHALVRGLILVLADTHCAQHILTHLFANLWFPFALIVKSMSQWLHSSQKIKEAVGLPRKTSGSRDSSISRPSAQRRSTPTVTCEFHGLEVMASTARFLSHLFNLMDRGYIMQRVRDLMIFLEILPRMPVEEIDRLNELRFELLTVLSHHEFFIQLNLPSLGLFQGGTDEEDNETHFPSRSGKSICDLVFPHTPQVLRTFLCTFLLLVHVLMHATSLVQMYNSCVVCASRVLSYIVRLYSPQFGLDINMHIRVADIPLYTYVYVNAYLRAFCPRGLFVTYTPVAGTQTLTMFHRLQLT